MQLVLNLTSENCKAISMGNGKIISDLSFSRFSVICPCTAIHWRTNHIIIATVTDVTTEVDTTSPLTLTSNTTTQTDAEAQDSWLPIVAGSVIGGLFLLIVVLILVVIVIVVVIKKRRKYSVTVSGQSVSKRNTTLSNATNSTSKLMEL